MRQKFRHEVAAVGLPTGAVVEIPTPITDAELTALPEAAQRYFRFMGVVGRPRDWSFRISFRGRFRTGIGRPWMPCETWQYNTRLAVARVFHIRIRFGGIFPVVARDTYVNGNGRMLVKLLDLIPIQDGQGEEYDISELVTYLNDAVLIAPSMLLVPEVSWEPVDASSFGVALSDHNRIVKAQVIVDERGAPKGFSTTDRFCSDPENPKRLIRARWTTPVYGWQEMNRRQLVTFARAVWHLPEGPYEYADFQPIPESLAFNIPPGQ